jgi:ATP-binding cassette subfamily B protein
VVVVAGVGLVAVNVVLGYLVTYLIGATEQRLGADMRTVVFRRLHELPLRFHDDNRTGDLVTRLTDDVSRVRDMGIAWFDRVLPEGLTLAGILVITLLVDPWLTVAALSVVPLLLYYAAAKRPVIRAAARDARSTQGQLATLATDSLRNVRLVQAFSRQEQETQRFRDQVERSANTAITSLDVSARYSPIASLVLALGVAVVSWLGILRVLDGQLSVGTLVVFLSYLAGVYGPIRTLSRLVSTFSKGAASRERLQELFEEASPVEDRSGTSEASPEPERLELRRVSFSYQPGAPVLRGIDLAVQAQETVCVVGASGAGKSTLLALLLRLYEPTEGVIELGGVDTRVLTLDSLRSRMSLVPQDPWIIDGTIAENVRFGHQDATRAEFRFAARRALVDEFALRLPLGFDTQVGEAGVLLSGGQLKRIALARALIRDAPLLLLDEPTTGLDATATEEVLAAIESVAADRTVLVVSHDLRLAARADRVVVIADGTVTQVGSHAELAATDGLYRAMWIAQLGRVRLVPGALAS